MNRYLSKGFLRKYTKIRLLHFQPRKTWIYPVNKYYIFICCCFNTDKISTVGFFFSVKIISDCDVTLCIACNIADLKTIENSMSLLGVWNLFHFVIFHTCSAPVKISIPCLTPEIICNSMYPLYTSILLQAN